jgi:Fe-S cluster biogenesis protein NfuA
MMTTAAPSLEEQIELITTLVAQIERSSDPAAQSAAREMVQALLDLHTAGFARMLELIGQSGDGRAIFEACLEDDLVGHLLLLHGLHPEDLDTRVRRALDQVRPYLQSHGGDVELLEIVDGTVELRLQGSCHGCPSSLATLQSTIERAIYEAAPDVAGIQVAGLAEPAAPPTFVSLETLEHVRPSQ